VSWVRQKFTILAGRAGLQTQPQDCGRHVAASFSSPPGEGRTNGVWNADRLLEREERVRPQTGGKTEKKLYRWLARKTSPRHRLRACALRAEDTGLARLEITQGALGPCVKRLRLSGDAYEIQTAIELWVRLLRHFRDDSRTLCPS